MQQRDSYPALALDFMRAGKNDFLTCLIIYYFMTLVVFVGVSFGYEMIPRHDFRRIRGLGYTQPAPSFWGAFANWDGVWHREIVERGYIYNANRGSNVIFFPGYPLTAHIVRSITGVEAATALLMVSHAAFFISLWLLRRYASVRFPNAPSAFGELLLLIFSLWPISIFFRFAYGESLFVVLTLLGLYGIQRRWRLWKIAAIVGAATGVRAVGLGLVPVFVVYLWKQRQTLLSQGRSKLFACLKVCLWMLISVWGLASFMVYLAWTCDDPLAFHHNHVFYNDPSRVETPLARRLFDLVTLEPIWSTYLPESTRYWAIDTRSNNPLFVFAFIDPIFFVGAVAVVCVGWRSRVLDQHEFLLAIAMLLIPYVTKGYDNAMRGHARYALVVFPVYLVLANWMMGWPIALRQSVLAFCAALMFCYAALFAAWHEVL